jgi:fructose-1,6-bisphosphatase/inositol monophosphatase family enzyme
MADAATLLPRVRDFRRMGSIVCDLRAVATGELDAAVIFFDPCRIDVAAGAAVVVAAGGRYEQVRSASGVTVTVAANPAICGAIVELLTPSPLGRRGG